MGRGTVRKTKGQEKKSRLAAKDEKEGGGISSSVLLFSASPNGLDGYQRIGVS